MDAKQRLFVALGFPLLLIARRAGGSDWPQFNVDSRHSGNNPQESTLHAGNVATLHVSYHVTLPAVADGAPAFLGGVATPQGQKDLLFLETRDGRLLALDAATGATVWSKQPATGPGSTTSSPAVDPNRQFVYAYGLDGLAHKYQVGDGTEIMTGGWPQVTTLKPGVENGSSALSIVTAASGASYLYIAHGGYPAAEAGDFQGHITAIDLGNGSQNAWNANCSDQALHFVAAPGSPDCSQRKSGVWARAGVVYDPDTDHIYFATGDGPFDADQGGHDWGDSILALHPDGTGAGGGLPLDAYTPVDQNYLQANNLDLGSSAPAVLPAAPASKYPHLAVQAAKEAELHLVNLDNLSGQGGPGHTGGELEPVAVPQGGGVLTSLAVWVLPQDGTTWMFVANDNGISAMQLFVDASGNPTIFSQWSKSTGGGSSPIVANGIVYYAGSSGVQALDPVTGNVLWHDAGIGAIHWESPIAVNGRLYVADQSAVLWAYEPNLAPLGFYTLTPCRLVDTRNPDGPFGGPALAGGSVRTFAAAGQCGVPADALAIAANITAVYPSVAGNMAAGPANVVTPTATINFASGQLRANNSVISLTGNPVGSMTVQAALAGAGSVHLLIDVSGYFK
jgi:outer membrane protein assembly factor BamB